MYSYPPFLLPCHNSFEVLHQGLVDGPTYCDIYPDTQDLKKNSDNMKLYILTVPVKLAPISLKKNIYY